MKTTKALMLASFIAISLGAGSAMAQTNDPNALTWTNRDLLGGPGTNPALSGTTPQAGSSDVDQTQRNEQHFPAWVGYDMMVGGVAGG